MNSEHSVYFEGGHFNEINSFHLCQYLNFDSWACMIWNCLFFFLVNMFFICWSDLLYGSIEFHIDHLSSRLLHTLISPFCTNIKIFVFILIYSENLWLHLVKGVCREDCLSKIARLINAELSRINTISTNLSMKSKADAWIFKQTLQGKEDDTN